ncbi:hypothetical protein SHKM778_54300 [Streptomyces sp. KM77-8]|uniref:GNAT family N-acetyltransferase n=1 Tax=Streptomyces haneummycinicus TaxID=3074435 RepID=A0AAT9HNX2_9ACTN
MGALLSTPQPGLDTDPFDAYCDHLLVREETSGQVVGTYRLLPPERAGIAGRLYAEGSSTSPGWTRYGRPSSRSAAAVCTPTTGTGRSSGSSGPASPAT